jgi:hypothetical protein
MAKLSTCGVIGVSCNEYLKYALENRREWEKGGKNMIADGVEETK